MAKKQPDEVQGEVVTQLAVVKHEERAIQRGSGFSLFDPAQWAAAKEQCGMLLRSGFFPSHFKTVEQVVAVAMMARDLGIPMTTALQDIFIEERSRKPSTSTKLLLALVKRHPDYQWHSFDGSDEEKGVFTIKVKGNPKPEVYTFTTEDARNQDLLNKYNWKKLKKIMLRWRAASIGIREQLPDIWLGYTHEELGSAIDVDQDGDIVHAHAELVNDSGAAGESPSRSAEPKTAAPQADPPPPTPKREPPTWDHGSHTSTVAKEKPASAESITAAGAKVRQTDTSVVIAKIRATMANSLFSDADRKLAEDRIHKNAPDEQGAQYLPWAEKNLAIVQAALVSRQKNAKKDTEAQRLDDIKTKAQDVIMDKCWTDLERAALTERLPKETGTVTTATKFLDEIHNRLVSKTPPCNCDLPWDEKGNPQ